MAIFQANSFKSLLSGALFVTLLLFAVSAFAVCEPEKAALDACTSKLGTDKFAGMHCWYSGYEMQCAMDSCTGDNCAFPMSSVPDVPTNCDSQQSAYNQCLANPPPPDPDPNPDPNDCQAPEYYDGSVGHCRLPDDLCGTCNVMPDGSCTMPHMCVSRDGSNYCSLTLCQDEPDTKPCPDGQTMDSDGNCHGGDPDPDSGDPDSGDPDPDSGDPDSGDTTNNNTTNNTTNNNTTGGTGTGTGTNGDGTGTGTDGDGTDGDGTGTGAGTATGTGDGITKPEGGSFDDSLDKKLTEVKQQHRQQVNDIKSQITSLNPTLSGASGLPVFNIGTIRGVNVVVDFNKWANVLHPLANVFYFCFVIGAIIIIMI